MGKDDATPSPPSNMVKDPDDWTTGDERMTGAQQSYLKTLSDEAGEQFDADLTKAESIQTDRRASAEDRTRVGALRKNQEPKLFWRCKVGRTKKDE